MFGVAVLASVFSANGSYATPTEYVAGLQPAIALGAGIVAVAAVVAVALPARIRRPDVADTVTDGAPTREARAANA